MKTGPSAVEYFLYVRYVRTTLSLKVCTYVRLFCLSVAWLPC